MLLIFINYYIVYFNIILYTNKGDLYMNKKIIFLSTFFILIFIVVIVLNNIQKKELDPKEIIKILEEQQYKIVATKSDELQTKYISIYNNDNTISIIRFDNTIFGTSYMWQNNNINLKSIDILENTYTTEEQQKQYDSFLQWLNNVNLTKSQIIKVLDYCSQNMTYDKAS